jgi:hypothetical protein
MNEFVAVREHPFRMVAGACEASEKLLTEQCLMRRAEKDEGRRRRSKMKKPRASMTKR